MAAVADDDQVLEIRARHRQQGVRRATLDDLMADAPGALLLELLDGDPDRLPGFLLAVQLLMFSGSGIPETTTERVRASARELRYRPNATARLLRTDRSHAIGFVTDEITSTPFAGDVVEGAQEAAWEAGKILMIVNTGENRKIEEAAVGMMLERRVEGIIHASMYHRAVEPPADSHEVPTVLLNCYAEDGPWSSVVPDEVSGGRTATDALLDKGHERVGFINLAPTLPAAIGRLQGYKEAFEARGLPFDGSLVVNGDGTASSGYRLAAELMRMPNPRPPSSAATTRRPWGPTRRSRNVACVSPRTWRSSASTTRKLSPSISDQPSPPSRSRTMRWAVGP